MLYILVDTTGDALIMSSRAQMDACGVLCHLEVHPFITAINWAIVDASSTGVTTMDKADLPRLFLCQDAA